MREEAKSVNWEKIASASEVRQANLSLCPSTDMVTKCLQLKAHSPIECKLRWLNNEHDKLNTKPFTKEETSELYRIVAEYEERDWLGIAKALGTNRTATACLKQYRKKPLEKKDWTPAEDSKLKEAISMYGANWQSVARHVGRTSNQCINRWTKTLKPGIKRGRWTKEEDDNLRAAVAACGTVWKKVGLRVRGRTDQQCRERWANVLDPRVQKKNWTQEVWNYASSALIPLILASAPLQEDDTIMRVFKEVGPKWAEISKAFDGRRTDNSVRNPNT